MLLRNKGTGVIFMVRTASHDKAIAIQATSRQSPYVMRAMAYIKMYSGVVASGRL